MSRSASVLPALGAFAVFAAVTVASAQPAAPRPAERAEPESCPGLIAARPRSVPAAFKTALAGDEVRITYAGHSTFLIESPQLVRVATDYNDYLKPPVMPDIVTMNRAHSTHYTDHPDPGIAHVLRGWRDDGAPAGHDVTFKDVRVRSIATNIRDFGGGTARHGNSIFVFEIANLCIAHLGHLHHTLNAQQLAEIGKVDAVMFPVDGTVTLDLDGMVEVLQALKAQVMIPMHYFSAYTLERFLSRVRDRYPVDYAETPSLVLSKTTVPASPKFIVLSGRLM
jgi:L-ascorbate metabolism protein UlaG (beta-lactamase superfamily)